ncbi:MAG: hypothetical protein QGI60_03415 [archaeon]|jgi:hypothetical protein|nr:hypothetical protein [archaeon]
MVNSKGQESAPFELLIAVIIMGFVIFAGMQAMRQLWLQKCFGTTDAKLEELKTLVETSVSQKSPRTINFRLSGCFNEGDETIEITDRDEPGVCADYCGSPKPLCSLLEYSNDGTSSFTMIKCLEIPPDTFFPSQKYSGGSCSPRDKSVLIDLEDDMPQGDYLFVNETLATDTFPTICAYRKEL